MSDTEYDSAGYPHKVKSDIPITESAAEPKMQPWMEEAIEEIAREVEPCLPYTWTKQMVLRIIAAHAPREAVPVSQPSQFILCEECDGTGRVDDEGSIFTCRICDGEPKITFATVKDYAEQIDSLLNEKMKLPSEMQVAKLVVWAQDAAVILTVAKDEGIRISRLDQTVASADAALAPWRER